MCWENTNPAFEQERIWTREAVARTWEAASSVRFVEWDQCPEGNSVWDDVGGFRIEISDERPHVDALGKGLGTSFGPLVLGDQNKMVLNFTFQNWSPECAYSEANLQFCIEGIAVHEFGHALGFSHEQNRPDTPDDCDDAPQGTNGSVMIGDWDIDSVMNYCNPHWNNHGELSETDILMVQAFYGNPNAKPVAVIEKEYYSVPLNHAVFFNATQSYDPEGGALSYWWRFGDTSQKVLSSSPYIEHVFNTEGEFAVFLTVHDDVNGSISDLDAINNSQSDVAQVTVYDPVKIIVPVVYGLL